MKYAQLNENSICVGVSQLAAPVISDNMVEIQTIDADLIGRKYENGIWSDIKYDTSTGIPVNEIEKLKQENLELKLALAELAESLLGV